MRHNGTRSSKTRRRVLAAAVLGITSALALQSTSALGGQPEDWLAPLRGEVALLTATYSELHPDVVKARSRLEHGEMVVGAWQCLEEAHKHPVADRSKDCVTYKEVLSAVDTALMENVMLGRDMSDLTERAEAWGKFKRLSDLYESLKRPRRLFRPGSAFPQLPDYLARGDWLLMIDALDSAGESAWARQERARFESQSPMDWSDCSGPLREDDFVIFMSDRLADEEEYVPEMPTVLPLPGMPPYYSIEWRLEQLRKVLTRCATESLGWSAADVTLMEELLSRRRPMRLQDSSEVAEILETFNRRRH